ncbi:MAG: hypothetical protein DWH91_10820 [Planctomycetota bacterium]|nr:MAG: hypothetical protein DWH91_10820 [Planctomycetota bacterium]
MLVASQLFTDSDRQRINQAVQAAEQCTSAEIVPVVATASGRYDRAEDIAGLWLGIAGMVTVSQLWPANTAGSWGADSLIWHTTALAGVTLVGFLTGAAVVSRVSGLRRLFTPSRQMTEEVQSAAATAFFDNRVHHTTHGGGLLVYISLYERMVVLLPDQSVRASLGQPVIEQLCQSLTEQLRASGPSSALLHVIPQLGGRLSAALPQSDARPNRNERPDALVTID